MTDTSVTPIRESKRADQLAAGDWVAAGPYDTRRINGTDDAEVLFVYPYVAAGHSEVALTIREHTAPEPMTIHLRADEKVTLLTADELAAVRAKSDRRRIADEMHALADLIAVRSVPLPPDVGISVGVSTRAEVQAIAAAVGVSTAPWIKTGLQVVWPEGRRTYDEGFHFQVYTSEKEPEPGTRCEDLDDADPTGLLHSREADDPTPVSPARVPLHIGGPVGTVRDSHLVIDEAPGGTGLAPAPIAAHYETRGWKGEGPGSCGVECACGVGFDGFDTLAEAGELLDRHIADQKAYPVAARGAEAGGCE